MPATENEVNCFRYLHLVVASSTGLNMARKSESERGGMKGRGIDWKVQRGASQKGNRLNCKGDRESNSAESSPQPLDLLGFE